jgi:hypothetical protein
MRRTVVFSKIAFLMPLLLHGGIMAIKKSHRSSTYPLGQLLIKLWKESNLSIKDFVLTVGYKNPTKGIRSLDSMIFYGYPVDIFIKRLLSSPLSPGADVVNQAIEQTSVILREEARVATARRKEEERAAFRPFFQAVPELSSPTQLCFFALTGGHSRYTHYLPDGFPDWPISDQYEYLAKRVPEVYEAAKGRTLYMGQILAYRLFRWYDTPPLLLSIEGTPLKQEDAKPLPDATIQIGSRVLTPQQAARLFNFSGVTN